MVLEHGEALGKQCLESFEKFPKRIFLNCTKLFISFLNFTLLPFEKYFLKKTYINQSHEEIEFVGRLCFPFFTGTLKLDGLVDLRR